MDQWLTMKIVTDSDKTTVHTTINNIWLLLPFIIIPQFNFFPDAVFAGPMPTMATIKLVTKRPIVNHPHYEDAGLRARTKNIYSMYSRKPSKEVASLYKELKVDYAVLEDSWCYRRTRWVVGMETDVIRYGINNNNNYNIKEVNSLYKELKVDYAVLEDSWCYRRTRWVLGMETDVIRYGINNNNNYNIKEVSSLYKELKVDYAVLEDSWCYRRTRWVAGM